MVHKILVKCGYPPQRGTSALWQVSPVLVVLTCFVHGLSRNHARNDSCITIAKREVLVCREQFWTWSFSEFHFGMWQFQR